eukprot:XP_016662825.1 PREDICTED: longitudinals lacking protein, isoforms N/O/W/X/Y-like [Acyrthosiphon pisum]
MRMSMLEHIDPIECPNFCGRSYKGKFQKYSLRRHLIYECGVVPQFECPECQKRFADKGKHLLPDPLFCQNKCGRYYTGKKRKSSLKRHLTYECGIDPQFKCIYCPKRFTVKTNMKRHVLLIHKVLEYV